MNDNSRMDTNANPHDMPEQLGNHGENGNSNSAVVSKTSQGALHDSRRAYKRFDVSIEGKCILTSGVDSTKSVEVPVKIKNISKGGALFISLRSMMPGVAFILSYKPPSKGSAPGYGIQERRISMEVLRQKEVSGNEGVEYVIVARSVEAKTLLQPSQWKAHAKVLKQLLVVRNNAGVLAASGLRAYEQFFDSILEEKGYQIRIVNNTREALQLIEEGDFDAVLTDIETASNDRYDFLDTIKSAYPYVDLMITMKCSDDWFNCLLEKAEEYIEKLVECKEINIALEKKLFRLLAEDVYFVDEDDGALRQRVISDILNRIHVLNRIREAKEGEMQTKTQYQRKSFRMYLPEGEQIPCTMELESGKIIECTISDLSIEGFGTVLDARSLDLSIGTPVKEVRIPLPNGDLVKGHASVKFISPIMGSAEHNCGMEFVGLPPRYREKISKYIYETHGDAIKQVKGKIDALY